MRKGIILLTVLVLGLLTSSFVGVHTVKAQLDVSLDSTPSFPETVVNQQSSSPVYIRPDGSVDPSNAPISHVGDVYRVTGNLYNALIVKRNNIVIDGGGFTLQGPGIEFYKVAINLTCTNTTVRNFDIKGWTTGVLGVFNNNTISKNNFINRERHSNLR